MFDKFKALLDSRRFLAAMATLLAVILNDLLGLPVSEEGLSQFLMVVVSWILGDSFRKTGGEEHISFTVKLKSLFGSSRFWFSIAGIVTVLINEVLGLPISEDEITRIVMLIATFVVGSSLTKVTLPGK